MRIDLVIIPRQCVPFVHLSRLVGVVFRENIVITKERLRQDFTVM